MSVHNFHVYPQLCVKLDVSGSERSADEHVSAFLFLGALKAALFTGACVKLRLCVYSETVRQFAGKELLVKVLLRQGVQILQCCQLRHAAPCCLFSSLNNADNIIIIIIIVIVIFSFSSLVGLQPTCGPGLLNTSPPDIAILCFFLISSSNEDSLLISSHLSRGLPTSLLT